MKRLLIILSCICCLFSLSACSTQDEPKQPTFTEGDIVVSSLGESYTQLFTISSEMSGDSVEIISHTITATRELDILNPKDYALGRLYYKYLYTAKVIGKVDNKYANRVIYIYTSYPISVQTEIIDDFRNGALIQADGTFEMSYYVYANEILEYFTPRWIEISEY